MPEPTAPEHCPRCGAPSIGKLNQYATGFACGTKWDRIRYQIQIEHYKNCVQDFREQKGMG